MKYDVNSRVFCRCSLSYREIILLTTVLRVWFFFFNHEWWSNFVKWFSYKNGYIAFYICWCGGLQWLIFQILNQPCICEINPTCYITYFIFCWIWSLFIIILRILLLNSWEILAYSISLSLSLSPCPCCVFWYPISIMLAIYNKVESLFYFLGEVVWKMVNSSLIFGKIL